MCISGKTASETFRSIYFLSCMHLKNVIRRSPKSKHVRWDNIRPKPMKTIILT